MHRRRRGGVFRSFDVGDVALHRLLHFLEGANFNLAHALA